MAEKPKPAPSSPGPQPKTAAPVSSSTRPDMATIGGILLALGGILGGLLLEGGSLMQILQGTAAMIVFGGTIGAVLVTTPLDVFLGAMRALMHVFFEKAQTIDAVVEEIIGYATKARKNGIVSLEAEAEKVRDPFLRKALNLAVDGTDLQELRKMMELELTVEEQRREAESKVFEAAGGYAPTVGIIGAVLGLIQVMQELADIEKVGKGIAVAFVATVYGVGSANIFFLPAASKIKARAHQAIQVKEMILEGVVGIVEGLNPKLIRIKLDAYIQKDAPGSKASKAGKAGAESKAGKESKEKPPAPQAASEGAA